MENLRDLYGTLDRLNRDELEQVFAYVRQRMEQPQIADENAQTKIAVLRDAVKDFWGDISQDEVDEIVEEMNSEYVEPLSKYDWLDEEDEN